MVDKSHILVVDDDRRIRELIKTFLMGHNFMVTVAASAAQARDCMKGLTFDLIVLDIMMPGETGLDFTRSLRNGGQDIPVLMLSALADANDRINGLTTGSDDYLVKPFEPHELLLRIRNLLRRVTAKSGLVTEVSFGEFRFHLVKGELRKQGVPVKLTSGEKELLRQLALRAGTPLGRYELAQPGAEESARSVDVQINRLRQKIEKDLTNPTYIQTLRGLGYALFVDEELRT